MRSILWVAAAGALLVDCGGRTCDETRSCGARSDASADSAGSAGSGGGAASDAGCTDPKVQCSSACTDLKNDPVNCGACDHDCGGGDCTSGRCAPALVCVVEAGYLMQLQVDGNGVYFAARDSGGATNIDSCPLSGCTGAAQRIRANTDSEFAVANGYIGMSVFTAAPTRHIELCPTSGCPATPPIVEPGGNYTYRLGSSASDIYWILEATNGRLSRCASPTNGACTGTVTAVATGLRRPIAATDSDVYVTVYSSNGVGHLLPTDVNATPTDLGASGFVSYAAYGRDDYLHFTAPPPRITRWEPTVDGGPPPTLGSPGTGSTELAVDGSGLFWIDGATIQYCPVAGCPPAGSAEIAAGLSSPHLLRLQGNFVYWGETTTTADGGSGWTIRRIAKPL
jgi:hypothetical protein